MTRESCEGCYYYRRASHYYALKCCHYMYDTGMRRGCPAENCDKKRPGKKPKKEMFPITKKRVGGIK